MVSFVGWTTQLPTCAGTCRHTVRALMKILTMVTIAIVFAVTTANAVILYTNTRRVSLIMLMSVMADRYVATSAEVET